MKDAGGPTFTLVARRRINASAKTLFAAWTEPRHLKFWWGPANVKCIAAEIELQVGGRYRIGNQFPDGKVLWIAGEFEVITPPHKLVYTWRLESDAESTERVTVRFEPGGGATEVIVIHERIANVDVRDTHEQGWIGCLDGLANYLGGTPAS